MHYAKTHFAKLLQAVRRGEEVVITKAGLPLAKLIPFEQSHEDRIPGSAKGMFKMPDDFDEPLPRDVEDSFWK